MIRYKLKDDKKDYIQNNFNISNLCVYIGICRQTLYSTFKGKLIKPITAKAITKGINPSAEIEDYFIKIEIKK